MKNIILILSVLFASTSFAAFKREQMDIKLPTQAMLERQDFGKPAAASATALASGLAGPTSAAALTLTSGFLQPDVPRNLTITPTGTTADVGTCVITVTGTNYTGKAMTETFSFASAASTATVGAKAFRTVRSIAFAASCETGTFAATWNVGLGEKIGLKKCLASAGDWAWSHAAGAYETTRATVVANASAIENNTADFAGTMNGSNTFIGYYVQNWAQSCN